MDEAILKVAKKWNQVAEWSGHFQTLNIPDKLEIPRWLQHLIVFCMLYSTFSLCSAYYLVFAKRKPITRQHSVSLVLLKVRIFFALCLATCPVIQMVIKVHEATVSWVDVTVCGFMMFGWLMHQQYLRVLETELVAHHAGHVSVNLSWGLTVVALVYQVSFTIYAKEEFEEEDLKHGWDRHVLYASGVFQFCYLFVLVASLFSRSDGQKMPRGRYEVLGLVKKFFLRIGEKVYGIISLITFSWVDPLMDKGANQTLNNSDDLFHLPPSLQSQNIDKMFHEVYENLKQKNRKKWRTSDASETSSNTTQVKHVPLFEALIKCFGYQYFALGFLKFATDCTGFVAPVLLNKLLLFLETSGSYKQQAYYYAACLCLCTLLTTLLSSQFFFLIYRVALKVRAAVITTVYRKSLATNSNELMKLNAGEMINFISNDADRILSFCPNFHNVWSLPLQILSCMYLLYTQVEMASLFGMSFGLAVIYTNFYLAKKIAKLGDSMMNEKDARVKLMNEALHGIHVIKLNAWERHFIRWISGLRESEVASMAGRKYLDAVCVYFWATSSMLIAFLTFFAYVFVFGKTLTTSKVFTSFALINILLVPLNVFPWTVNGLMEAWVSLKRIERLLTFPEIERRSYYTKLTDTPRHKLHLQMKDAMFMWGDIPQQQVQKHSPKKKKKKKYDFPSTQAFSKQIPRRFVLGPINLEVMEGQFIGIYGQTGSGKSSLLQAIMAEMWKTTGTVALRRHENGFGFVSQDVWVHNGTIKDNILFGLPLDLNRYQAVLESCALVEDLEKFPSGDSTEIGEKGAPLSVGQRMRISLARALYQKKNSTYSTIHWVASTHTLLITSTTNAFVAH
uniref:ABC-type xenobiotic transporter n=1 Tax=Strigamia maritima TaxID=126957 RepID=T1JAN4_STRMM